MARFNLDDYVTVQERINKFWTENPDGAITTQVSAVTPDHKSIIVLANVYKSHNLDNIPDATGIAQEHAGNHAMVNTTSWVEAAETSAIGRALANMGYATSNSDRPSREEMEKVQRYEDAQYPQESHNSYSPSVTTLTAPQNAPQLPPKPDGYNGATQKQLDWIASLERDVDEGELAYLYQVNEIDRMNLTGGRGGTASRVIDVLNARKKGTQNRG
jgi:hypothetical protein